MADIIRQTIPNELGRTGLVRMDGTLYEEFLPQLRGLQGVRKYREMSENNAIISAVVYAIESLLRSVEWRVEPATKDEDQDAVEFLEQCMDDMSHSWEDFIAEVLTMLVYGWSYFEVTYKQRMGPDTRDARKRSQFTDGRIGWRKFAPRAQDTLWKWKFDAAGGIQGMWQEAPIDPDYPLKDRLVYLPIAKSLLFRTTSRKNSPEGRSMLRGVYRSYQFVKRMEEVEGIGAERDLAGMPIAFVPVEVLAQDRTAEATATYNTIKDLVTRVKRDEQEGIIFPLAYDENGNKLYDFQLLASSGKRQFDVGAIIQRYNQQIAMSLLADFILLGHESVGSFALSSDKTELFSVSLGAILDSIENVLNRHAVPDLFALNSFDLENLPKIRHGDIEKPNLTELGGFIQAVTNSGFLKGDDFELENFFRDAADMPQITKEEYEQRKQEALEQQQMMFEQQKELSVSRFGAGEGQGANETQPARSSSPRSNSPKERAGANGGRK